MPDAAWSCEPWWVRAVMDLAAWLGREVWNTHHFDVQLWVAEKSGPWGKDYHRVCGTRQHVIRHDVEWCMKILTVWDGWAPGRYV